MISQLHPSQSTETPDLRIVPVDSLIEHEYNDVQRTAPLAQRLEADGILKNPPIVTPLNTAAEADGEPERYVVLDGANRSTALQSLGYPHILVQVVKYQAPHVILTTWHHVITGVDQEAFSAALDELEGLDFSVTNLLEARAGLARRELLAYTVRADGQVFAARTEERGLHEQNRLLNAMVSTYKDCGQLFRATTDHIEDARRLYEDLTGLVIFPSYVPAEVLALARDGELLPTGLTRHLIQGRALRTNYPLGDLKSGDTLEAKNARLEYWLRQKLSSKEMRFYGEATFLFDE